MDPKYKPLFTPIKLKNWTLPNRFVLSPITLNAASFDGHPTQEEVDYALLRAHSAPIAITTGTYVNVESQLFEYGFGIQTEAHIESLKPIAQAMKKHGAKAVIQFAHAGRFSEVALKRLGYVKGPSKLKLNFPVAHEVLEMTHEDIKNTIDDFVAATIRAIKAGFDGVEISSAQKLLPQAFFSKISNTRTDQYGPQSLENRARFTLELLKAVQTTINQHAGPDFVLGFRATAEETRGNDLGYGIEDFLALMDFILQEVDIDYLALANWGQDIYKYRVRAQGKYYNRIVNDVVYEHLKNKIPIIASGGINTPEKCIEALQFADMIGLSSVFVTDPDFVTKIAKNQIAQITLKIDQSDFQALKIPKMAFQNLVKMMDSTQTLPKSTRDAIRNLKQEQ